ncbi:methyltransferase [Streptomyces coeruleorubidus]|uniref:Ribosomal RNA large subunit methyltransferase G n=1 Tax=Streptomyces coeruleorubidus TaxID=116188 RepID=A0A5J6I3P8_STRC4|nr:methyltransferase [Streptomyces coeruleorubidus]QEV23495.1 methyltransferase domain-containing protein [Streptomyces coeruleorubidus]GGU09732.1 ribosomal RNA large subunit methyltransferase G [Streptomyces coeruleorubidus]
MTTPWGELALTRFPEDPRDRLRAWDASDEYLLRYLAQEGVPLSGTVVVVGDRWGALVTALAEHRPAQITDSHLTQEATRANLARHGVEPGAVRLLTTQDPPPGRVDVLLVRVPKSLALLEDQLLRLAPAVHAGTVVVGTGMVKEIHTSTLRLFERILGPTRTSLAEKKARLIFCTPDPALERPGSPWPYVYTLPDGIGPASGRTVVNHAGVFCADRLDIGTRFFLEHLPGGGGGRRVVDLGCGNGVVGTAVALADPAAEVLFVDESFQAVASAEATYKANGVPGHAEFRVGDGLAGVPADSVDLVLNNPPFHSHQATTDATAWRMFTGARRALRPGGELWVIGNRHLGYHVKLRKLFGNSRLVASDPKFVVLKAVKR